MHSSGVAELREILRPVTRKDFVGSSKSFLVDLFDLETMIFDVTTVKNCGDDIRKHETHKSVDKKKKYKLEQVKWSGEVKMIEYFGGEKTYDRCDSENKYRACHRTFRSSICAEISIGGNYNKDRNDKLRKH